MQPNLPIGETALEVMDAQVTLKLIQRFNNRVRPTPHELKRVADREHGSGRDAFIGSDYVTTPPTIQGNS
jgi:hypothetical protein